MILPAQSEGARHLRSCSRSLRPLSLAVSAIFLGCCSSPKPEPEPIKIEILQQEIKWGWPESERAAVELLLRNSGKSAASGVAEIRGTLQLAKLNVQGIAQYIKDSNIEREFFESRLEKEIVAGNGVSRLTMAIPLIFDRGWVQEPINATIDIPLDNEAIPTFEFAEEVQVSMKPLQTQIVKIEVAIPKRYSHRKALFAVQQVHVSKQKK